jgi:CubicO group peptidase (beta-lactamase class C family)
MNAMFRFSGLQRALLCVLFIVFVGFSTSVIAQKKDKGKEKGKSKDREFVSADNLKQRIDHLVQAKVKEFGIPGYSLTVMYKGEKIIEKGYGFADLENKIPVTPQTVFGLASITKTFTGLALLKLVDDRKVNLNDPLSKYYEGLSPAYQKITILQLASMTAGVPAHVNEDVDWKGQIKNAQESPLESKPGTQYAYSNLSYRILGGVIEKASGQTYIEYLQKYILTPFGMTNTKPSDQAFSSPVAIPYNDNLKPLKEGLKSPSINFAAGMLASNTVDMVKYAQALVHRKLLTPQGYESLWKERPGVVNVKKDKESAWAFGWGSALVNKHLKVGMNGGLPGVASSIFIFPDDDLIIVGLSNKNGEAHEVSKLVLDEVLGRSE